MCCYAPHKVRSIAHPLISTIHSNINGWYYSKNTLTPLIYDTHYEHDLLSFSLSVHASSPICASSPPHSSLASFRNRSSGATSSPPSTTRPQSPTKPPPNSSTSSPTHLAMPSGCALVQRPVRSYPPSTLATAMVVSGCHVVGCGEQGWDLGWGDQKWECEENVTVNKIW